MRALSHFQKDAATACLILRHYSFDVTLRLAYDARVSQWMGLRQSYSGKQNASFKRVGADSPPSAVYKMGQTPAFHTHCRRRGLGLLKEVMIRKTAPVMFVKATEATASAKVWSWVHATDVSEPSTTQRMFESKHGRSARRLWLAIAFATS